MPVKKLLAKRRERRANRPSARVKARKYTNKLTYGELVDFEAKLGRTVFGPIPSNRQREFFKDRGNIWIWYEKFIDDMGMVKEITVRYDVRPTGVLKKSAGGKFEKLAGEELKNFELATKSYLQLVKRELYC